MRACAAVIIAAVRREGRSILTEFESKQLLTAYGIPTVKTAIAATPDAAVAAAEDFGYPIVLKLHSKTITHKTDVGGVQLNLQDAGAVRTAFGAIESSVRQRRGRTLPGSQRPADDQARRLRAHHR